MSATHTISRRVDSRPSPSPALVPEGPAAGSFVGYLRHVVVVAKRSLIKTWRTPEALIDVTVQPIIFLAMFTYIFGGAIAPSGSQQQYLQFLLPGILGQTIAMAGIALGHQSQHRHREGDLRPVPLAADRPVRAAGRGRGRRRRALHHAVRRDAGSRLPDGLPDRDELGL